MTVSFTFLFIFCFFFVFLFIYFLDVDDDVSTGQPIFDGLQYNFARTDINIAYIANSGAFLPVSDQFCISPGRGGVTSNYGEKLLIYLEFLSDNNIYKLETIEVHNPTVCNVNSMNTIRLNFLQQPYEPNKYWKSLLLNGRAVIDLNYYKYFETVPPQDYDLDILEINFLSTKDNRYPANCELRAFMQRK